MFENRMNPFENIHLLEKHASETMYTHRYNTALNQFKLSLFKGKVFCLKSRVLHRGHDLYDLETLKPDLHVHASCYSGIKVVPIRSIIGSEGRTADFDAEFHPLNEAGRERWVNMAIAYLSFLPLPPIQLIQIGDGYFVRDGHHRISVSQAFGQLAMDAEVITWKASPPFPWQTDISLMGKTLLTQGS